MQKLNGVSLVRLISCVLLGLSLSACDGGNDVSSEADSSSSSQNTVQVGQSDGGHSSIFEYINCEPGFDPRPDGYCLTYAVSSVSSSAAPIANVDLFCPEGFKPEPVANVSIFCVATRPLTAFTLNETCPNGIDVSGYCFYPEHECAWGQSTDNCVAICAEKPESSLGLSKNYCEKLANSGASSSSSSSCPNGSSIIFGNTCGYDDTCAFYPEQCQSSQVSQSSSSGDCPFGEWRNGQCVPFDVSICESMPNLSHCGTPPVDNSEALFNNLPCGVGYTALGNGSWQACFASESGTASCLHKESPTQPIFVTWDDGQPVVNAAQITGAGYYEVILVTVEGAVYFGNRTSLRKDAPLFESGGISASGGQNTRCAIIADENRKDIRCWKDNSDPYRPELPLEFDAVQLSANYSDICALNKNGEAWCWEQKPDNSLDFVGPNPSVAPFSEKIISVSVGQLSICGVKLSGGLECLARWDSTNYLPSKGSSTSIPVPQLGMEDVIAFQAGFDQGVSVHSDGSAKFWKAGRATLFGGVTNAIAAAGDRDVACVLTKDGNIFCLDNKNQAVKVNGDIKAAAGACPL